MNEFVTLVVEEVRTSDGWEFSKATVFDDYISARRWILARNPDQILEDWGEEEDRDMDGFMAVFEEPNGDVRMRVEVAERND